MKITDSPYKVFIFLSFGNVICYLIRFSLNVAILEMADSEPTMLEATTSCRNKSIISNLSIVKNNSGNFEHWSNSYIHKKYIWTEKEQGVLISSFFYGYMIATLLIGNIIKPSSLLCLGIGGSGALLIVFKNFADFGINGAIMVRVLQGICQGGVYPSQNAMWGKIVSNKQRNIFSAITISICLFGNMASNMLTGYLCKLFNWEITFSIFGIISILWTVLWILCNRNVTELEIENYPSPIWLNAKGEEFFDDENDPLIKPTNIGPSLCPQNCEQNSNKLHWVDLLTSRNFWLATYGHLSYGILANLIITGLPRYLYHVHGLTIDTNGFLSSLPFLFQIITSIFASVILDRVNRFKDWVDLSSFRNYCALICLFPTAIIMLLISQSGCNLPIIMTFICLSSGFLGSG